MPKVSISGTSTKKPTNSSSSSTVSSTSAVRDADGSESTVVLRKGDTFVVPKGTEHKPSSPGGSILMFEPRGTSSTGDRHEGEIPDHIDSTTGHALG